MEKEVKISCNGLIVRLRDGCIISWDGTSIWHYTLIRIDPKNDPMLLEFLNVECIQWAVTFFPFTSSTHLPLWSRWKKFAITNILKRWVMQWDQEIVIDLHMSNIQRKSSIGDMLFVMGYNKLLTLKTNFH